MRALISQTIEFSGCAGRIGHNIVGARHDAKGGRGRPIGREQIRVAFEVEAWRIRRPKQTDCIGREALDIHARGRW